ncbi:hypothetical protein [Dactylosporangium sp. CA-139066]|uniref:hypothetical protein n=1 Tax=Dactylosporangium sp. CA-139066 TaxID=3239930 RepID=UPI003D8D9EB7
MLTTPPPPRLADDAYTMPISTTPTVGELGAHTFGRTITQHLTTVLRTQIDPPIYRENRQDQRHLPKAATYELTITAHTVLITSFDTNHPLSRTPLRVYAIEIDDNRIPFELTGNHDTEWQIARTIWLALPTPRTTAPDNQPPHPEHGHQRPRGDHRPRRLPRPRRPSPPHRPRTRRAHPHQQRQRTRPGLHHRRRRRHPLVPLPPRHCPRLRRRHPGTRAPT